MRELIENYNVIFIYKRVVGESGIFEEHEEHFRLIYQAEQTIQCQSRGNDNKLQMVKPE